MFVLLGSRAARAWFADFRAAADWDVVAPLAEITAWSRRNEANILSLLPRSPRKLKARLRDGAAIEFEALEPAGSTGLLAAMAPGFRPTPFPGGEALAATPAALWLTKRSHASWPVHWGKTIRDLHWLKPRADAPTPAELAYYEARAAEHAARFGQRGARLNMSNEAFFAKSAKAVPRAVEHDRLHELVAYHGRPLFERFKTDLSKASLDRALFERAAMDDKLRLVREEAMVIALERTLIPALPEALDPALAYGKALERICTNLTSGWFRDFAIDHWPDLRVPDKDFLGPVLPLLKCHQPDRDAPG